MPGPRPVARRGRRRGRGIPLNLIVYCDGSALATGGPGGIAYVARREDGTGDAVSNSRQLPSATNQQAEILAAAFALDDLPAGLDVVVRSDSQYLVNGWGWLPGWIKRGWRTRSGRVANQSHWRRLQEAVARHESVSFEWLKGHAGDPDNERCDELAGIRRREALEVARVEREEQEAFRHDALLAEGTIFA